MLFVYLFAMCVCVSIAVGSIVLLSVSGAWVVSHTLGLFVLVCVLVLCSWAIVALFHAAREELVYWF